MKTLSQFVSEAIGIYGGRLAKGDNWRGSQSKAYHQSFGDPGESSNAYPEQAKEIGRTYIPSQLTAHLDPKTKVGAGLLKYHESKNKWYLPFKVYSNYHDKPELMNPATSHWHQKALQDVVSEAEPHLAGVSRWSKDRTPEEHEKFAKYKQNAPDWMGEINKLKKGGNPEDPNGYANHWMYNK